MGRHWTLNIYEAECHVICGGCYGLCCGLLVKWGAGATTNVD